MPAYMIAFVDIHDRTRYTQEYMPPILGTLEPFGGRILASSDEAQTLEGTVPPGRTMILEFPDLEPGPGVVRVRRLRCTTPAPEVSRDHSARRSPRTSHGARLSNGRDRRLPRRFSMPA